MNWIERLRYKAGLVEALVEMAPRFHLVAELPPGVPQSALKEALRNWAARIDRRYLGRRWSKACRVTERMAGMIFFETGRAGGHRHAHLLVRPPLGADESHFFDTARYSFHPHPDPNVRQNLPRPVTSRGKMHIDKIRDGADNLERISNYVTKDVQWSERSMTDWALLSELS